MRVGLKRHTDGRRRQSPARRPHGTPRPESFDLGPVDEPVAQAAEVAASERELSAEWRLRASGGPEDRASYHCGCGYVFDGRVSTSVSCPNCGSGQAW